jgi:predicted  nucleic acid-binding Zn-ribbon protein
MNRMFCGILLLFGLTVSAFCTDYDLTVDAPLAKVAHEKVLSVYEPFGLIKPGDRVLSVSVGPLPEPHIGCKVVLADDAKSQLISDSGSLKGYEGVVKLGGKSPRGEAFRGALQMHAGATPPVPSGAMREVKSYLSEHPWVWFAAAGAGLLLILTTWWKMNTGTPGAPPTYGRRAFEDNAREIKQRLEKIADAQEDLVKKPPVLRSFKKQISNFEHRLDSLERTCASTQQSIANLTSQVQALAKFETQIAGSLAAAHSDMQTLSSGLTEASAAQYKQLSTKLESLATQVAASNSEVKQELAHTKEYGHQQKQLSTKLESLAAQVAASSSEVKQELAYAKEYTQSIRVEIEDLKAKQVSGQTEVWLAVKQMEASLAPMEPLQHDVQALLRRSEAPLPVQREEPEPIVIRIHQEPEEQEPEVEFKPEPESEVVAIDEQEVTQEIAKASEEEEISEPIEVVAEEQPQVEEVVLPEEPELVAQVQSESPPQLQVQSEAPPQPAMPALNPVRFAEQDEITKPLTPTETPGVEYPIGGLLDDEGKVVYAHGDALRSYSLKGNDRSVNLSSAIPPEAWRVVSVAESIFCVTEKRVEVVSDRTWTRDTSFDGSYVAQCAFGNKWAGIATDGKPFLDVRSSSGKQVFKTELPDLSMPLKLVSNGSDLLVADSLGSVFKVGDKGELITLLSPEESTSLNDLCLYNEGAIAVLSQPKGLAIKAFDLNGKLIKQVRSDVNRTSGNALVFENHLYFFDPDHSELLVCDLKKMLITDAISLPNMQSMRKLIGLRARNMDVLLIAGADKEGLLGSVFLLEPKTAEQRLVCPTNQPHVEILSCGENVVVATSSTYQNMIRVFSPFSEIANEAAA